MKEFCGEESFIDLGDKRLNRRLLSILDTMAANPSCSIPERSTNWGQSKAIYRFMSNKSIESEQLGAVMNRSTAARCAEHPTVVISYDTTNVAFSSSAPGLGYLDRGKGTGLMVHSSLCTDVDGNCLGLLSPHIWARDIAQKGKAKLRAKTAIEEKESYRWIKAVKEAEDVMAGHLRLIHVADREADIYELLSAPRRANSFLLVRATHPRKLSEGTPIWERLQGQAPAATISLELKKTDGTMGEPLTLEVRYGRFELRAPNGKKRLGPVCVSAVLVTEKEAAKGSKEAICWKLLTTLELNNEQDALEAVRIYGLRWNIERFHFVLKSGCRLEDYQLRSVMALERAVLLCSICALRLMILSDGARADPQAEVGSYLNADQCRALQMLDPDKGKGKAGAEIKTVGQAVWILGRLGGFLGRKGDGQPGVKNLWRGLRKLDVLLSVLKENPNLTYG